MASCCMRWPVINGSVHTHTAKLDPIAQQSEPYRNIGKMHVLYSFSFVEMASCDLQI